MSQKIKSTAIEGHAEMIDPAWKSLYKLGGICALIAAVLFLSDIFVLTSGGPAPENAGAWLTLLQDNKAAGLLQLFFSDLFGLTLLIPVILALYTALKRTNLAYSTLAAVLAFIGITLIIGTNFNYSMLYLSSQYAAATTEAARSQLLGAAESTLAAGMWGTGALMASLLLEGSLLMISVIMLQGGIFGRGIAYLGILVHGLDLARVIVFLTVMPFFDTDLALTMGVPLLIVGGTLQLIWYPLVARRLWQLGR